METAMRYAAKKGKHMKLDQPVITEHLILRSYRNADMDFCIRLWCDAENGKYMSDPLRENIKEDYLACFENMEDDPDGYYLIAEFRDSHNPVGTFCMFPENGNYDIGYCVAREYWRQGIGREMLAGALVWMKAQGAVSVTAEVADENIASRALLHAFGFQEGRKKRFRKWYEDTCFDSHVHVLKLTKKEKTPAIAE